MNNDSYYDNQLQYNCFYLLPNSDDFLLQVKPKPPLLQILRVAGAQEEVFTMKDVSTAAAVPALHSASLHSSVLQCYFVISVLVRR